MKKAKARTPEQILREYVKFKDVNGNVPVTILPITITDIMEEYAEELFYNSAYVDEILDDLLVKRGEHPTRVRNPVYSEERKLAKDLLFHFLTK